MDVERYFQKSELIPAVVQEAGTGEVLGATSGHIQKVVDIKADCDDDTLLITVIQTGAACHTGAHSCFFKDIWKEKGGLPL